MANLSKKDQIKNAVMAFLNKEVGSVTRTDIDKKVSKLGSARTITRALGELKTDGKLVFTKGEGKAAGLWTSTESKTDSKKTDSKKKDTKKNADKKSSAGSSTKTKSTKKITKDALKEAATKGSKAKTSASTKPEKQGKKKPGVIATIIAFISKKNPKTKAQILAKLTKKFPERDPEKMMKTINVQVPSRLRKDKELNVQKTDKGYHVEPGKWKAPKK